MLISYVPGLLVNTTPLLWQTEAAIHSTFRTLQTRVRSPKQPTLNGVLHTNQPFPGDSCMHMVQCDGDARRLVLYHVNNVRFVQNDWRFP